MHTCVCTHVYTCMHVRVRSTVHWQCSALHMLSPRGGRGDVEYWRAGGPVIP